MNIPKHTLYRFFAKDGSLLYVGRTVDARGRWRSHEKAKDWFDEVAAVTREIFDDAASLSIAEVAAIRSERPQHNIQHNERRVDRKVSPEPDDIFITRLWNWSGQPSGALKQEELCGEPDVESWCECIECHELRMAEVESVRDEFSSDSVVQRRLDSLLNEYADGVPLADWICDVLDIRIFRPMELAVMSRESTPVPAFAEATARGIQVDCPLCGSTHEHFMLSGASLSSSLESPCRYDGRYVIARGDDWLEAQEEFALWVEDYEKRRAA